MEKTSNNTSDDMESRIRHLGHRVNDALAPLGVMENTLEGDRLGARVRLIVRGYLSEAGFTDGTLPPMGDRVEDPAPEDPVIEATYRAISISGLDEDQIDFEFLFEAMSAYAGQFAPEDRLVM